MEIRVNYSIIVILNASLSGGGRGFLESSRLLFNFQFSLFNLLDYQALGGGGVGGAEGEEVGAGGVLGN